MLAGISGNCHPERESARPCASQRFCKNRSRQANASALVGRDNLNALQLGRQGSCCVPGLLIWSYTTEAMVRHQSRAQEGTRLPSNRLWARSNRHSRPPDR
jgi:hypothetical protein